MFKTQVTLSSCRDHSMLTLQVAAIICTDSKLVSSCVLPAEALSLRHAALFEMSEGQGCTSSLLLPSTWQICPRLSTGCCFMIPHLIQLIQLF